jgi:hypothetical protein
MIPLGGWIVLFGMTSPTRGVEHSFERASSSCGEVVHVVPHGGWTETITGVVQ